MRQLTLTMFMADGIKISIENLNVVKASLEKVLPELQTKVSRFLDKHALAVVTKAKQKTPVDEGILRGSISADTSKPTEKHITVNAPYAAFVEFGTGKYAAQHVSTLPDNWQAYAAQFKGQKGGSFHEMILRIAEWIGRKSIYADTALHGTFSVKTRKRTGNKVSNKQADLSLAYVIARSILINGIHAQPFLYPAYKEQLQEMIKDLPNLLK